MTSGSSVTVGLVGAFIGTVLIVVMFIVLRLIALPPASAVTAALAIGLTLVIVATRSRGGDVSDCILATVLSLAATLLLAVAVTVVSAVGLGRALGGG